VDQATARKLVLASLGTMFAVIAVRSAQGKEKGSTFRRLWATGTLALLLGAAADFIPDVAGPLALLIGLTYVMGAEDAIANWFHAGIGKTPATTSSTAPAVTGTAGHVSAQTTTGGVKQA
jgi:hypothetical protein